MLTATATVIPTMGLLHEGHLSLFREAQKRADVCAASLFVNPTQFGPNEDLARYPRDEAGDFAKMEAEGVSLVFAPGADEIYPPGEETRVEVERLSDRLCGRSRPGHFRGVATVVLKLFNLFRPEVAVFGEKDFQQLMIIRRMARDLFLDVEIVGAPLIREADGLALSSRNSYLSAGDRQRALGLSRALKAMQAAVKAGELDTTVLRSIGSQILSDHGLVEDYLAIVDEQTLDPVDRLGAGPTRALITTHCASVRLIDNAPLHH